MQLEWPIEFIKIFNMISILIPTKIMIRWKINFLLLQEFKIIFCFYSKYRQKLFKIPYNLKVFNAFLVKPILLLNLLRRAFAWMCIE